MASKRQSGEAIAPAKPIANNATTTGESNPPTEVKTETKLTVWEYASRPANVPSSVQVFTQGQDTGRKNAKGQAILAKGLQINAPTVKKLVDGGMAKDKATEEEKTLGLGAKESVAGRVISALGNPAVILRNYRETKGKRDRMQLTLERVSVETTVEKLAREYGLTVEEVKKRLNITEPLTLNV